jgi:hypothetical protein
MTALADHPTSIMQALNAIHCLVDIDHSRTVLAASTSRTIKDALVDYGSSQWTPLV